jgi:predicted AAA+ superfamily ATPase
MKERRRFIEEIEAQFRIHSVCALLGPRQVGKTTLAHMYMDLHPEQEVHFFDLEDPQDLGLMENPMLTLSKLSNKLIIIDEIQLRPELFPVLRVLVDKSEKKLRFLILGSASRDLIRQSSETLAGRIGYIELPPFSLSEVHNMDRLWLRGGLPKSYLAKTDLDSYKWRMAYISTFLERDIPSLGFQIPPNQIRRFWLMLAHSHGQIFNGSEIGRSLGVSDHTVRKYLDILIGTFMMRLLSPWFENLSKRQVKSPKVYFRDSGILHALLSIENETTLMSNPRMGSFWEGFALEEIIRFYQVDIGECFFWGTQSGAELDLLIIKDGKRLGFEFKFSDTPKLTKSMQIALNDLNLDHLYVIYPGTRQYSLSDNISVTSLQKLCQKTIPSL